MSKLATLGVPGITMVDGTYIKVEYPLEVYRWAKQVKDGEKKGFISWLVSQPDLSNFFGKALASLREADIILVAVALAQVLDPRDEIKVGFTWTETELQDALSKLK